MLGLTQLLPVVFLPAQLLWDVAVGLVAPMAAPGALWSLLPGKAPGWCAAAGGFWLALAASEECLALVAGDKALPVSQTRLAGLAAKSRVKGMALDPLVDYSLGGGATHDTSATGSTRVGAAAGAFVRLWWCGAALEKQTALGMCRGVWILTSCREGVVLGCCCLPAEGTRAATAT